MATTALHFFLAHPSLWVLVAWLIGQAIASYNWMGVEYVAISGVVAGFVVFWWAFGCLLMLSASGFQDNFFVATFRIL